MTKNMSYLLSLSLRVRNTFKISSNTVRIINLFHTSYRCDDSLKRDNKSKFTIVPKDRFKIYPSSAFIKQLNDCTNIDEVCEIIRMTDGNLKIHEAVCTLTTFSALSEKQHFKYENIPASEFSLLCEIIKKKIRQLSNNELLQILRVLTVLGVPSSSHLIQLVLQMIRESVNDLMLKQAIRLNFILLKCQKTPLVEALSLALPLIIQSKMNMQSDFENMKIISNILQYDADIFMKLHSLPIIIEFINKIDESVIKVVHAKIILSAVSQLRLDNTITQIILKCQRVLINSTDKLYPKTLDPLLKIITHQSKKNDVWYNESLMDMIASTIISEDMGFDIAVNALSHFNEIGHISNSLLDYIAAKYFENQNFKGNCNTMVRTLISGMSYADYKPAFWDVIKPLVLHEDLFNNTLNELIPIAIELLSLDCFWSELIKKIFSSVDTTTLLFLPTQQKLLLLYKIIKTQYPNYDRPWPSDELLKNCESVLSHHSSLKHQNFPLKSTLENLMGGSQYVLTNVNSSIGFPIDHVTIMRQGGFPIALNNQDRFLSNIEQLDLPSNSQLIIFMYIPGNEYARNSQRLSGFWSLVMRAMKSIKSNCTVIPIHGYMWNDLSDLKRLQYISQAIKLKCDGLLDINNL